MCAYITLADSVYVWQPRHFLFWFSFHRWNRMARAHFHVLATLWDTSSLSLPRYVQLPFEMQETQIRSGGRVGGERTLITFALKWETAAYTQTTKKPWILPSSYTALTGEACNSSNRAGDRDASSWAPRLTFHWLGAAQTGKPQRRAASLALDGIILPSCDLPLAWRPAPCWEK